MERQAGTLTKYEKPINSYFMKQRYSLANEMRSSWQTRPKLALALGTFWERLYRQVGNKVGLAGTRNRALANKTENKILQMFRHFLQ